MTERAKFIRKVHRLVQSVDARWRPNTPSFQAGMVLVAACVVGTNETRIADALRLPEGFVRRVAARCRKQRIWRVDKIRAAWDLDDVAFVCDALVAAGQVERPADPKVTAKNQAVKAKRVSAGLCTNCGRPRDTERRVCSLCRESMTASKARRKASQSAEPHYAHCEPWYQIAASPAIEDRDDDLPAGLGGPEE